MNENSVQDLLTAWRAAERRLEETTDSGAVELIADEIERLRDAYRRAVDAVDTEDVKAHDWRP